MSKTVDSKVHLCPEFKKLLIDFRDQLDDLLLADGDPGGFAHRCDTFNPLIKSFARYMLFRDVKDIFYEL